MAKLLITIVTLCFLTACQSGTKKTDLGEKAKSAQVVEYEEMEFDVTGMTCAGCEKAIVNGLNQMEGIVKVQASHKDNKVVVKVEKGRVNRGEVVQKIETVGYQVVK